MRRTLVTPAAMAAMPSLLPHTLSPLHFHSFSHSCQSQGLCKETPNELHGRGTKTQFQFQFRFQFGFCFSVSNLNFNLQKCIGRRSLWLILCVCGWHHNKWGKTTLSLRCSRRRDNNCTWHWHATNFATIKLRIRRVNSAAA